jgi:hypothetical protein
MTCSTSKGAIHAVFVGESRVGDQQAKAVETAMEDLLAEKV